MALNFGLLNVLLHSLVVDCLRIEIRFFFKVGVTLGTHTIYVPLIILLHRRLWRVVQLIHIHEWTIEGVKTFMVKFFLSSLYTTPTTMKINSSLVLKVQKKQPNGCKLSGKQLSRSNSNLLFLYFRVVRYNNMLKLGAEWMHQCLLNC